MKYYKFCTADNKGEFSHFDYTPYLPHDGKPGEWLPKIAGDLEACRKGYHACDKGHLLNWREAQLFEVEFVFKVRVADDKVYGRKMRLVKKIDGWNDKNLRLFAVWCAREALKLINNPDSRSVAACDVAERYANGEATDAELAAAWAAAGAAAWDAAGDAAGAAAWNAARAAARNAAEDAQTKKLCELLGIE